MSSCIICGTSVDGRICDIHQEDVLFEFRGSHPNQLTPGRYYRGSVDGFAEFGVFVDIGDSVTGLLHESELDRRLDNLPWDSGDTVFVQVKNVRDNGNVDLGWSIRQSEREFRGKLIDDPEFDAPKLPEELDEAPEEDDDGPVRTSVASDTGESEASTAGGDDGGHGDTGAVRTRQAESATETGGGQAAVVEEETSDDATTDDEQSDATTDDAADAETGVETEAELVAVEELDDLVGETVTLEGVIESARQTSGPTVFELRDGTGVVDCAAFKEAGVRAYPEVEADAVVRLVGEVRERRGELQIETEQLAELFDEERDVVADRMESALLAKARPDAVDPLAEDEAVEALSESLRDAAGEIRRAVFEDRPVVVRHSATADGYVAGAAIERATLPLVREQHANADAEYHYFDRRPLEGDVYEMDDATKDVTEMLDNRARHDEALPLFVFVAAGGTRGSLDGLEFLDVYDAPRLVVDTVAEDEIVAEVDTVVSPDSDPAALTTVDGELDGPTTAVLGANVAAHVNDEVREDLTHLPAISYWEDVPEVYADAAAEAGYDTETVADIRDAVALEAYYQSYEDKRELIADLLFAGRASDVEGEDARGLASHVSEQFRNKLSTAVQTAEANFETRAVGDIDIAVLDTQSFTHRFDFPPETLLLDELFRRNREEFDVLVGASDDDLHLRSAHALDVRTVADAAAEAAPEAGIAAGSTRSQELTFLAGEREAVLDAVVDAVADELA